MLLHSYCSRSVDIVTQLHIEMIGLHEILEAVEQKFPL